MRKIPQQFVMLMTAAAIIVTSRTSVAMEIPQAAQAQQPFAITTHSSLNFGKSNLLLF